eukprot:GHVL01001963.1.p1 GENE.GHVL01001963.1~~GHVL01001963.1.p1  ORF type:complete len:330 (+),score=39.61 GHVL01001963.1:704-1693(+)
MLSRIIQPALRLNAVTFRRYTSGKRGQTIASDYNDVSLPSEMKTGGIGPSDRVSAHYLGGQFMLKKLSAELIDHGMQVAHTENYLFAQLSGNIGQHSCSAVIFKLGCVVFWHMNTDTESRVMRFVENHHKSICRNEEAKYPELSEAMISVLDINEGPTRCLVDRICLTSSDSRQIDELALSFALASAVRLNVLETLIECDIENIRQQLQEKIKKKYLSWGKVSDYLFSTAQQLHDRRYQLNIENGLLEVPDELWELPIQESLYEKLSKQYDLHQRVTLLNAKLNWSFDCLSTFKDQVHHEYSARLEKIIIILIAMELAFSIWNAGTSHI